MYFSNKTGELQVIRIRELDTLERARTAQSLVDQTQAELLTAVNRANQQQQITQIQLVADQQTALANTATDDAAQRILDGQAIHNQAAIREAAAQALRDQAVIDQQTANQTRLAAQNLAAQAVRPDSSSTSGSSQRTITK